MKSLDGLLVFLYPLLDILFRGSALPICLTWNTSNSHLTIQCLVMFVSDDIFITDPFGKVRAQYILESSLWQRGTTHDITLPFTTYINNNEGEWTCRHGSQEKKSQVSYTKSSSPLIDIDISAENYKLNEENRFELTCSSCLIPLGQAVEIYVNDITVDMIRHVDGKCYHRLRQCTPSTCTCAAKGRSFTWIYVSALSIIQFACKMEFFDEIKSTRFLHKAEITFNRTAIEFLNKTDNNTIYGQEGKNISITCIASNGQQVESLSIIQNLTTLSTSGSNIVTYSFKANRQDHRKEYECLAKKNLQKVHVTLLVYYAPDVEVFATGKHGFKCLANGFPDTYTFNKWEHQSQKGEHVRYLVGFNNGTLHLHNLQYQYQISGRYICSVSNGIPDVNGDTLQKDSASLRFIGHPIFAPENRYMKVFQLFKPITLSFLLYSDPIVDKVVLVGVADNYTKNETIHDFRIYESDLIYTEFEQKRKIRGFEISIDFKMISNDYRTYNIFAFNVLGGGSFAFKIRADGQPIFAPENRYMKVFQLFKPITLSFLLYSDPIVDEIVIVGVADNYTKNESIHGFRISGTDLMYTEFEQKRKIRGFEISLDFKMISNDYKTYTILALNVLGGGSFSFKLRAVGTPIMSPENRNLEHAVHGQHVTLKFVICCNFDIEDIWIEVDSTGHIQTKTKDALDISKQMLLYTAFGNTGGDISRYEIIFKTSLDVRQYIVWAKHELGVDFYRFEIKELESLKSNRKDKIKFIISSSVAVGLLVYISVMHICFCVKRRTLRTRHSIIPDDFQYHIYDDIDSVAYQVVNINRFAASQQGPSNQTRNIQRFETSIDNQQIVTGTSESSLRVSENEYPGIDIHHYGIERAPLSMSSSLPIEDMSHSGLEHGEEVDTISDSSQLYPITRHQDEQLSINYGTPMDSTSSENSKSELFDPASSVVIGNDGYENPYQIVIQESQPIHEYSSIINQSELVDEQLSTNYGTSIDSESSEDSKSELFDPATGVVIDNDGYENPYQVVIQDSQPIHKYSSIINQSELLDEQLSTNYGTSIDSTSSEDSKSELFDPASSIVVGNDGYENPYQIVIQESQPNHEYSSITNQSELLDEQLSTNYGTSIDSESSEDSKSELFDPATGVVIDNDGYENPYQVVIQDSQPIHKYSSIINQSELLDEQLSTNYGTSIDSTSSEDSKSELFDPASSIVVGNDGYENPYQIVIQESQPNHEYSSITNQSELLDEQLSTNYGTSIDSESSEDSKMELFDPASGVVIGNYGNENPNQIVIQEIQPIHQYSSIINQSELLDEQLSTNNGTSIDSESSEDSKMELFEPASCVVFGNDGYENPYQIVIQENQPTHQYSSIINQPEHLDSATPTDIKDFVNLQF